VTYDGMSDAGINIYVNASLCPATGNSITYTNMLNSNTQFMIGDGLNGYLDNVVIFDKALTQIELESLYNTDKGTENCRGIFIYTSSSSSSSSSSFSSSSSSRYYSSSSSSQSSISSESSSSSMSSESAGNVSSSSTSSSSESSFSSHRSSSSLSSSSSESSSSQIVMRYIVSGAGSGGTNGTYEPETWAFFPYFRWYKTAGAYLIYYYSGQWWIYAGVNYYRCTSHTDPTPPPSGETWAAVPPYGAAPAPTVTQVIDEFSTSSSSTSSSSSS
jgi:hypothetical protein